MISFVGKGEDSKVPASSSVSWNFQLMCRDPAKKKVRMKVSIAQDPADAAEWSIRLYDASNSSLYDNHSSRSTEEFEFFLEGAKPKELRLEAHAPIGSSYKDRVTVTLSACLVEAPSECDAIQFSAEARQSILALKTSIGHEKDVADAIASRTKGVESDIAAILSPTTLRGYVLIEGMNTERLRQTVKGVRKAHSFVDGEMQIGEIDHYLAPKPLVSGITEGDVVELVAGPFKGEKARVQHIDEAKEEITVELFEAMVPIPVTVRGDHVRVLEKDR
ncbi:MAG: transcription elongation factor Spt5 [Methanomassiliicoccaceae archaeon]|jgi:transcriptional antiterminator NusG|nr:transcription elongation factor Spt5 [Methanomassiliicoccaceae archaeon]HPP44301.1 transcription elongation factor Spt5 [Methanomassiliicoccaceae archaeon]HQA20733.1 transcription elongation factor Spt5 [Methanomassiliicoccaceae archaeon]HQD88110.1 transcription elongation factor Spt5 [Methanomassiliicoccaceae archaeon]